MLKIAKFKVILANCCNRAFKAVRCIDFASNIDARAFIVIESKVDAKIIR